MSSARGCSQMQLRIKAKRFNLGLISQRISHCVGVLHVFFLANSMQAFMCLPLRRCFRRLLCHEAAISRGLQ